MTSNNTSVSSPNKAVERSVETLQRIYAVVTGLALNESLKKSFVDARGDLYFEWLSFISLITFVALLVPFFHGMNRHMDEVLQKYKDSNGGMESKRYSILILFDFFVFIVESGILFLLATTIHRPENFFLLFILLISVDFVWAFVSNKFVTTVQSNWAWINFATAVILVIILYLFKANEQKIILICIVSIFRTILDYSLGWDFYFPKKS